MFDSCFFAEWGLSQPLQAFMVGGSIILAALGINASRVNF